MSFDLSREPLADAVERAAEIFLQIYTELEERPVDPRVDVTELIHSFCNTLGDEGVGLLQSLTEFRERVLPASIGTPHPLYLGLVNSSPLPAAVLSDLLVSSLNNNGGAFHQSPAMSAAEREVVRLFTRMFGLPESASGMLLPGGTFATLQALMLARARHFPEWEMRGPTAIAGQPLIYTSQATHFSARRSGVALGLGQSGVVAIESVGRGEIAVDALAERFERDRGQGGRPFAVVATAGSTGTGAIDPISSIADLCEQQDLWLHVDACYGGGAILLDELQEQFRGIERAQSIAVDPHKWFFIPMTAAILLTRDPALELAAFDMGDMSYIPHSGHVDALRRGLPTSRRSSGLTVWMALRAHGLSVVRDAVRGNIALTRLLEQLLASTGFRVLPGGQLSIACARWEPPGKDAAASDALQQRIAARVVESGKAWFSTTRHADQTWLRFNLVNLHTREHHIRCLAEQLLETARGSI